MATRMGTFQPGSDLSIETPTMPSSTVAPSRRGARRAPAPPRSPDALTAITTALLASAAVWGGLALCLSAAAFALPFAARLLLLLAGVWLLAGGIVFVARTGPSSPHAGRLAS